MKRFVTVVLCLSLLGFAGCNKDKKKKQDQPVSDKPPVTEPVKLADQDVPVPADFEAAADQEITADNYAKTLDDLEAELAQETE